MARKDTGDKVRLLRELAFQVHRKQEGADVLREYFDDQFRLGRRKEFRAANDALADQGFTAALQALDMIGDEAAMLLECIVESKDHRLLAAALNAMADRMEG